MKNNEIWAYCVQRNCSILRKPMELKDVATMSEHRLPVKATEIKIKGKQISWEDLEPDARII